MDIENGNAYEIITDANILYESYLKAKSGSAWKPKVQLFGMDWLQQISKLQKELQNWEYKPSKSTLFIIRERGKIRPIHGEQIRDRIVEHSLNDEVVMPQTQRFLIYDNGASQKGKGVDFTRKNLVKDLVHYYSKHGNEGYIAIIDFSKYYDNIRHDKLKALFEKYINDEYALYLLYVIIKQFEVDVSYMTDEEFENCLECIFNSIEYWNIDKTMLTGEKIMQKHLDIGNQTSQSAGVLYTTPLDNYIKIVCGEKYYARYMDDSYIIHQSKEHLEALLDDLVIKAEEYGIHINTKKTHIAKLSDYWRFLQVQYSLTDTGRIIRKINPKQITRMRRKMKKLVDKMSDEEYYYWFHSWFRSNKKYMSRQQVYNLKELYKELKGAEYGNHFNTK